ncbi:MAG: hypothetical protein V1701_03010 [Planctomycetota bacterium]
MLSQITMRIHFDSIILRYPGITQSLVSGIKNAYGDPPGSSYIKVSQEQWLAIYKMLEDDKVYRERSVAEAEALRIAKEQAEALRLQKELEAARAEAARIEAERLKAETAAVAVVPVVQELVSQGVPKETAIAQVAIETAKQVSAMPAPAPVLAAEPAKIKTVAMAVVPVVAQLIEQGMPNEQAITQVAVETARQVISETKIIEAAKPPVIPAPEPAPAEPAKIETVAVAVVPVVTQLVEQGMPKETAIAQVAAETAKQIVEPVKTAIEPARIEQAAVAAIPLIQNLIDSGMTKDEAIDKVATDASKQIIEEGKKPFPTGLVIGGLILTALTGGYFIYRAKRKR